MKVYHKTIYDFLPNKEKWSTVFDKDGRKYFRIDLFDGGPRVIVEPKESVVNVTMTTEYPNGERVCVRSEISNMELLSLTENDIAFTPSFIIERLLHSMLSEILSKRLNDNYESIHISNKDDSEN